MKVMIVDNDPFARLGIQALIPWHDYGMELVGDTRNGHEAIQIFRELMPDIVLVDISMSTTDGLEFIRRAKQLSQTSEFIVLTYHQEFDLIRQLMRLGVHDVIVKATVELEELKQVVYSLSQSMKSIEVNGAKPHVALEDTDRNGTAMERARLIKQAKDYIHDHLLDEISLPQVAEHLHLSPSHFSRIFKQETGESFTEAVLRAKAELAEKMIERGYTVTGISEKLGYLNASSFTRMFKRQRGFAPSERRA